MNSTFIVSHGQPHSQVSLPPTGGRETLGTRLASWLVCLPLDQGVWVQELAMEIMLCSWAEYVTLTVPLSTLAYLNE